MKTLFQIQKHDGLPNTICGKCLEQFKIAYNIIILCKQSDAKLKEQLVDNKLLDTLFPVQPDTSDNAIDHEIEIVFPEQQK